MLIIGRDYHPGFQQIACVDMDTGELGERHLVHREQAEQFYRELKQRDVTVRVGIEASGHSRYFEFLSHQMKETTRGIGILARFKPTRHNAIPEAEHVVTERNLRHESQVRNSFDGNVAKVLLHLVIRFSGKHTMCRLLVEVASSPKSSCSLLESWLKTRGTLAVHCGRFLPVLSGPW
jgi:hypothetical protein